MTGKRFTSQRTEDYNFSDILDNGKWIGICHVDCENDFVNKFNELAEENEQLKRKMEKVYNSLVDENEELKQIILFANELIQTQHTTQHDYWKFRTLCKENRVDLE